MAERPKDRGVRRHPSPEAEAVLDRIAARHRGKGGERLLRHLARMAEAEENPPSAVVREAILDSDFSLRELAELTGVDAAGLSRFVRKSVGLTLGSLDKLAPLLGLRVISTRRAARRK